MLQVEGRSIVDSQGEEVLLNGWGIGNWLCPEGYMWKSYGTNFDRPRRIRQGIEYLAGKEYAAYFWKTYEDTYLRKEDLAALKEAGFNSVRIPFIYGYFMEEGPGIRWKSRGFELLDRCIEWCRELGLYAILDLHGAPGGQTGSNIDDSIDNVPRLFLDRDNWEKAIALWERIAQHYCGNDTVAMYDILNEPIIPPDAGNGNFDDMIPELMTFYREVTGAIRRVDQEHILSIEGYYWATNFDAFDEKWDHNMVLHFHRYAKPPDINCLKRYLEIGEKMNLPIWMGETGENKNTWYAALYPLAQSLHIGYNIWPWKKMDCTNSFCSIDVPEGYEEILNYLDGGRHPGYERAREILDHYLDNIRFENCTLHPETAGHILRKVPFTLQAVDFDEFPGEGGSFHGEPASCDQTAGAEDGCMCIPDNAHGEKGYRRSTSMEITEMFPAKEKEFVFDCGWDRYGLVLKREEFAVYSFTNPGGSVAVKITFAEGSEGELKVELSGGDCVRISSETKSPVVLACSDTGADEKLKITGLSGRAVLNQITVRSFERMKFQIESKLRV